MWPVREIAEDVIVRAKRLAELREKTLLQAAASDRRTPANGDAPPVYRDAQRWIHVEAPSREC